MSFLEVPIYTTGGQKAGSQKLDPSVFGVAFKEPVVHQAVVAQQANRRTVLAHTKTRGEVRGGGRKPWRQKGTGRARHGSIRSPLWSGGGVTFGPRRDRNFSLKVNTKVRKQALLMVLSDKVASDRFIVLDAWAPNEGKTKQLADLLKVLPGFRKRSLLVTTPKDSNVIRASKNIVRAQSIGVSSLNVLDLLSNEYVIVPKDLVSVIEKRYKL